MSKDCISFVFEGYTFILYGRCITVESKLKGDRKELEVIIETYKRYKHRYKGIGRPQSGEWRWCLNPECNNAFYALRWKINNGRGNFCSKHCAGIVRGCQKGHRIVKCTHHWVIGSPHRSTSKGICKHCGKEREFENSVSAIEVQKLYWGKKDK